MNSQSIATRVFLALLAACAHSGASEKNVPSLDEICPDSLVGVKVVEVAKKGGTTEAALKIDHVYKGPKHFHGRTFSVSGATSGQSNIGMPSMFPPYEIGESQIWRVHKGDKDEDAISAVMPNGLTFVSLPARQAVRDAGSRYNQCLQWAKAVEQVIDAPAQDRRRILEQFAKSEIREIATWAGAVLGGEKEESTEEDQGSKK